LRPGPGSKRQRDREHPRRHGPASPHERPPPVARCGPGAHPPGPHDTRVRAGPSGGGTPSARRPP
jgi:hypothetical protein